jgi:acetylornithine deacetylase/succinyl-diaminopimelate desuccinylase-like protein
MERKNAQGAPVYDRRRSKHLRRSDLPNLVSLTVLVLLGLEGTLRGQQASGVAGLARTASVRAAIESARASEAQTIDEQIRFCEVPAPPFQESARAAVLKRSFEELRLKNVRLDRVGNVLADRPGKTASRLVVAAHLDTVFPEGTDVKVRRDGDRLSGPGIGDNCRGLAVLVAIARSMDQGQVQTPWTVTFVANVGEEGLGDLRGVKELFSGAGRIDRFVTIDNAGLSITYRAVGSRRYRVTFKGPGGHSFGSFGLANPANALGRAIAKISDFQVPSQPRTTFNVGRVGGGTSVNAIPFESWMEVDIRSSEPGPLTELETRFRRAVSSAVNEENARWGGQPTIASVIEVVGDRPAGSTSVTSPIVETAQAVARELGLAATLSEGSTDANVPMSRGIPAIAIGGGGWSDDSHAPQESFDATDSWKGTANAVLLTIALAQP